ncbi:hypothetical protein Poli38472_001584 [Pythium oligandrum]|uniref:Uncharacterized protein n=1 Tax=Pythium oligandrum TaxID=41045 RepID=A0A8K1CWA9_PYTOL|nr:hypothetical protein Poli38472_001584 [Pythium oligandrum]|eukprot:TMW69428.1 hypothetical protein Poli38472_001584 [Pythium oligandrum]
MDEREFQRLLERFPVVRKKTHARVEWNSMHGAHTDESAKTAAAAALINAQLTSIDESETMTVALNKFLRSYFSAVETQRIEGEFNKAHIDFLSGLSLEDIDDLCAQFVSDIRQ